jgi:hypothetical protein
MEQEPTRDSSSSSSDIGSNEPQPNIRNYDQNVTVAHLQQLAGQWVSSSSAGTTQILQPESQVLVSILMIRVMCYLL